MAAKDKVCGNNLVALKDLDLGAWIDRPNDIDCEDQRWIGAPDPTDNLKHWSGFDPCADSTPRKNLYTLKDPRPAKGMYFAWFTRNYITVVLLQCTCLYLIIYALALKDSCMRKTAVSSRRRCCRRHPSCSTSRPHGSRLLLTRTSHMTPV